MSWLLSDVGSIAALSYVSDVTLTSIASGELLMWNGSGWINQTPAEVGLGSLDNIVEDVTPQLGGTLDANGNTIDMGVNVLTDTNLGQFITAYGWGDHSSTYELLNAKLFRHSTSTYDSADVKVAASEPGTPAKGDIWFDTNGLTALANLVEDTTPQLGGTLDANANTIDMGTYVITDAKVGQWDTAYGWGDHSGLYSVSAHNHSGVYEPADATIVKSDETETISSIWDFTGIPTFNSLGVPHYVTAAYASADIDVSASEPGTPAKGDIWFDTNAASGFLANVLEDTSPQLGGTLDANSNTIDMGTNVLTDTNLGQFITAYGWGDHASGGYAALSGAIFTGLVQAPSGGTQSSPQYTFAGDTNTGIYRAATDTMSFTVGGDRQLLIGALLVTVDNDLTVSGNINGSSSADWDTAYGYRTADTNVTGTWWFSTQSQHDYGIGGSYSDGGGASYGGTIWSIDDSWKGGTAGADSVSTSVYGIRWLRASHASAHASIGEGLYAYTGGTLEAGMGTLGIYSAGALRVDGHCDFNGNIVGDGATTITGIESIGIDSTGDITKTSHGNYLYHKSTSYDNDQNGEVTFSTSAASGGTTGDVWFTYTA